jgi:hypothetical protein
VIVSWLEEEGLANGGAGAQRVASPFSCSSASWA